MSGFNSNYLRRKISPEIIFQCTVSSIFGIFTQLAVLTIPYFFGVFSLFIQILLSGVVLVIAIVCGQLLRRLLGVRASAPSFVLCHIVFIWLVYMTIIRQDVSPLFDILFNGVLVILLVGFFRMLATDPGFVHQESPDLNELSVSQDGTQLEELSDRGGFLGSSDEEVSSSGRRVRYCCRCKAYVMGFDHHCPAFGNCIGRKNHALFMALLLGFIVTEALYSLLSYQ